MKYNVIAIEREYASGGSEIGQKLGAKLGIPSYGPEILDRAAAVIGVPAGNVRELEETLTGNLSYSLRALSPLATSMGGALTPAQQLCLAEIDVTRDLVKGGPCIIVGRAAAGILKDQPRVLKVFVRADRATRLERATVTYGHGPEQAEPILRRFDKNRSRYYKTVSGHTWGDPANFHMVLDSGYLGINEVVDILATAAA